MAWDEPRRDELTTKAKWCVLHELKGQSEQMLSALEHKNNLPAYAKLYEDVIALDKYFGHAIEAATEADKAHPDWIPYPERDAVFRAISERKIM